MSREQELEKEISRLRALLSKAVIFEVAPDTAVGVSEEDGLWRVRRSVGPFGAMFLNKAGEWEEGPIEESAEFAARTGFANANEALEEFNKHSLTSHQLDPETQAIMDMTSIFQRLKNN